MRSFVRLVVKLALAALVANAVLKVGTAYATFYRFKDSVAEAAQFSGAKTDEHVRQRIIAIASDYEVPLAENDFTVRKENHRIYVDGTYTQLVEMFPRFRRPWTFTWHVEAIVFEGPALQPLNPK